MVTSHLRWLLGIACAAGLIHALAAQTSPSPTFEVASIKPNKSGAPGVGAAGDRFSNGQIRTTNIPLRLLIQQAFERMQKDLVVGGPAWMESERWDIAAKADSPTAAMLPMIRALLADRFKLVTHHEMRERPIYELVMARPDGRFGPSLHPSTGPSDFRDVAGVFTARAVPIVRLVDVLRLPTQRIVVDRTGLSGTYDIDLHWAPIGPTAAGGSPAAEDVSIFTAVKEQLGLKLESTREAVDVLVIDHVEKPTED